MITDMPKRPQNSPRVLLAAFAGSDAAAAVASFPPSEPPRWSFHSFFVALYPTSQTPPAGNEFFSERRMTLGLLLLLCERLTSLARQSVKSHRPEPGVCCRGCSAIPQNCCNYQCLFFLRICALTACNSNVLWFTRPAPVLTTDDDCWHFLDGEHNPDCPKSSLLDFFFMHDI